jgi:hypothetical protein
MRVGKMQNRFNGWCGSRSRNGDGGKDGDDGRLGWTARMDGFSAVEVCQPVGGVGEIWTASGGRPGCPNRVAAAAAACAANEGRGGGGWNSLGKREAAMRGRECAKVQRARREEQEKAAKVNRRFQECVVTSAAWMGDAQASMGDGRDVVANEKMLRLASARFFGHRLRPATPSHQKQKITRPPQPRDFSAPAL